MAAGPGSVHPGSRFYRKVAAGVWRGLGRDDCAGMAAAVAYHFIFSSFAGLFFLACLATQFGRSDEMLAWIIGLLANFLPPEGVKIARENIGRFMSPISGKALAPALLLSLWTASNVVEMLMKDLNRIYSVAETRPLWQTRVLSLMLVGLVALFLVIAFNLSVFGDEIRRLLSSVVSPGNVIHPLLSGFRWPLVFLTSGGAALLIYFLAPNFRAKHRRVSIPGAVFFALTWQGANLGVEKFVNVASFGHIYGPLAAGMIVLVWAHLSAFLLLIGGEINAHVMRQLHQRQRKTSPADVDDSRDSGGVAVAGRS